MFLRIEQLGHFKKKNPSNFSDGRYFKTNLMSYLNTLDKHMTRQEISVLSCIN